MDEHQLDAPFLELKVILMGRVQASDSISKISLLLSAQAIESHFLPLIRRLAAGDWFTSRTSACALFAAPYPNANPDAQAEMRRMFGVLGADDTPMVRRAAAKALGVSPPKPR